ncbi:hypothetical protein GCM10011297_07170 [Bacterioplanes sanyensis]|uniref:hypothetical protein n=1 Tax=Bacterioplanes sanyensis TaxID=1249553 RepID=UPI00167215D4|nr:hypothetical protein [Bacterioplanes sanyensis]GGY36628.1 hypothetical protein GCM10011297_07170 [Bacterioplanes sanyensis]
MDRPSTFSPSALATLAFGLLLSAGSVYSSDAGYYTTEIDQAVEHAQRHPVRTDMVGDTWYDRSTYNSFALPSLPNEVMDSQVIEGAMGPTAAGEAAAAEAARPVRQAALGRKDRNVDDNTDEQSDSSANTEVEQDTNEVVIDEISYESEAFTGRVRGVRSSVSIQATSRP